MASNGLNYLQDLSQVMLKQYLGGWHGNKYTVTTMENQPVFQMNEESSVLNSMLGGAERGFHMSAMDSNGMKLFSILRPFTWGPTKIEVSMNNQVVGLVRKIPSDDTTQYGIHNAWDNPMYRVEGDSEDDFKLQTADQTEIGVITKQYGGVLREIFDTDAYYISFSDQMPVEHKVLVISCCILIDYDNHEPGVVSE